MNVPSGKSKEKNIVIEPSVIFADSNDFIMD